MNDVEMPNDGTEGDEDGDVTVKVKKGGRRNGTNGVTAATPEAIKGFAAAFASGGRHFNVFRKSGPKGPQHRTYRGRLIQTGFLKTKLPPEAAEDLIAAVDEISGGGIYRIFPDNATKGEVLENVVIPGRPKPIDLAQAADDEADIEEGLLDNEALPHLGAGGYGLGASPYARGGGGYDTGAPVIPPAPPGFVWDPIQRRHVAQNPYAYNVTQDATRSLERENQELKTKATYEPLVREIAELKKDREAPRGESPFKSMIDMMQMAATEAAKQREHQLTLDREERKAKEAAEEKRADREREERKERREKEESERKAQVERDREDRIEREKTAKDLMTTLVKITVEGKGNKADPVDAMVKMITVMSGIKDLNTPAGEPEAVAMARVVSGAVKDTIGAAGEAWHGRPGAQNPGEPGAQQQGAVSEDMQLLAVLEFAGGLCRGKASAMGSMNAIMGFCQGRGYNYTRVCELLAAIGNVDDVAKFRETLLSKVSMAGASIKPKLEEAGKLLAEPVNQQWLLGCSDVARQLTAPDPEPSEAPAT